MCFITKVLKIGAVAPIIACKNILILVMDLIKYNSIAVGAYIKHQRKIMKKSQEKFAEEIGICTRHLRDIEAGKKHMSMDVGFNIARVLCIKIEEFYFL